VFLVSALASPAGAAESGFSAYGLGTSAFSAGETPPPGTYVSAGVAAIRGDINGALTFGGIEIDVAMQIKEFISPSANLLYVPKQTFLGGRAGFSMTVPFGFVDIAAQATGPLGNTVELATHGWGLGDMVPRLQLGWDNGDFHHSIYIQGLLPTGRYEVGFNPNIGLNRPAIDFGWGFTYIEPTSKLQLNGTFGLTTSFENQATDYDTGDEFHFEWAVGKDFGHGVVLGVVGYDYRQLSDDTGAGVPAILNGFKGEVDAVGPGLTYATSGRQDPVHPQCAPLRGVQRQEPFRQQRHADHGDVRILSHPNAASPLRVMNVDFAMSEDRPFLPTPFGIISLVTAPGPIRQGPLPRSKLIPGADFPRRNIFCGSFQRTPTCS
jgi:hypothetical protein